MDRLIEIIDPLGFNHRVLFREDAVYGAENLAHVIEEHEARLEFTSQLLNKLRNIDTGKWQGYIWKIV